MVPLYPKRSLEQYSLLPQQILFQLHFLHILMIYFLLFLCVIRFRLRTSRLNLAFISFTRIFCATFSFIYSRFVLFRTHSLLRVVYLFWPYLFIYFFANYRFIISGSIFFSLSFFLHTAVDTVVRYPPLPFSLTSARSLFGFFFFAQIRQGIR